VHQCTVQGTLVEELHSIGLHFVFTVSPYIFKPICYASKLYVCAFIYLIQAVLLLMLIVLSDHCMAAMFKLIIIYYYCYLLGRLSAIAVSL